MTAILLDHFGTLVSYSASRTEQGYPRSAAVLERAGCGLAYDEWLALWASVSEELDRRADETGIEFSMPDAYRAFAAPAGLDPDDRDVESAFLRSYLDEWSTGVRLIDGVPAMLGRLDRAGHSCALVSNTHDADMVRGHLAAMGLLPHLAAVVTSVEVGFRKPRSEIYAVALDAVGATADEAVFVGDTFVADYVGPTAVGIEAYLVAAEGLPHPDGLPVERRLASILDLEARIAG